MGRQSRAIQEPKDKAKPTRHETAPPPQSEQVCPATTALWTCGRGTTDASPKGAMKGRPASGRPRRALSTFRPWKQCAPSLRGRCQEQVHTSLPGSQGGTPRDQLPSPHVPELGAREAHRASPTGLPLVPRPSSNVQLMVPEMPKLQQPEAQVFYNLFVFISLHLEGARKPDSGLRFVCSEVKHENHARPMAASKLARWCARKPCCFHLIPRSKRHRPNQFTSRQISHLGKLCPLQNEFFSK